MIRSSKHILKYQTKNKNVLLNKLFEDYKKDIQFYIDLIISGKLDLTINLSSKKLPTNIISHSNWKQIIYKNASEIIRSQIKKALSRRYNRYKKLYAICKSKNIHESFTSKKYSELKLKPIFNSKYFTKPNLKNITITLDYRLIDFSNNSKYFDEFIRIKTPYFHENKKRAITICLPIKQHKHSLKYKDWERKNCIRLLQKDKNVFLEFIYEKEMPQKKKGKSLGIDQGYKKLISCSNGKFYGTELFKIYQRLSKKKQGSHLFKKLLNFRIYETNRIINEFFNDNKDLAILYIEDLKNVKKNSKIHKKVMNKVQRWLYSQVISKLERFAEENGIQIVKVNPAYTSQTCSKCGIVDKNSRNGELFYCSHCGYKTDADFNASVNIYNLGIMYPRIPKTN